MCPEFLVVNVCESVTRWLGAQCTEEVVPLGLDFNWLQGCLYIVAFGDHVVGKAPP